MKANEIGSLRIGGYQIPVNIENQHLAIAGVLGVYAGDDLKIMIRDDGPAALIADTVLHEVLHAITEIYLEGHTECVSEHIIAMLAQGLFQVLQDNPNFTSYVAGKYRESDEGGAVWTESSPSTGPTATSSKLSCLLNGHALKLPTT